ncbi:acylneuraminate cytidylyltransferase family protein [Pedobacter metabolipauper]|uniref:N-acylneuraminate cytidylyltransferase n=1 Tax=Pedobacter metabolipauper TaxID=425513 RepID=A0A4R6SVU6_9SPHI|nr:acylneuraminate cytidylyltransferase family protein [Pedobacter metabolipauper]TDQ09930.1 N-acylneuraminate cytidylyltransferase [Pedobacter metabolipauper]
MHEPLSFFLPLRKGSERVINKNTKRFAGIEGGILALKLQQLIGSKLIDEIVLSTNDEVCIDVAKKFLNKDSRIKIDYRPQHLCESSTKLTDLIAYVPTVVSHEHIIWGHVTTPIADGADYDSGIRAYFDSLLAGYDSLISVMPFQNFLLNQSAEVINKNIAGIRWPRTQDLLPLYEINHVMFIAGKNIYLDLNDRVGSHPFLFEMDKLHSLDVDWEDDFLIAEAVYERLTKL